MSIRSEIKDALNEIKYVFTEEYKKECEYIEFKESMKDNVSLKCDSDERIADKIDRLRESNFESNFHVSSEQLDFSDDNPILQKSIN